MTIPSSAATTSPGRLRPTSRLLISLDIGHIVKISTDNDDLLNANSSSGPGDDGKQGAAGDDGLSKDGEPIEGATNPGDSVNDPISSDEVEDIKASLASIIISREFASPTADRNPPIVVSTSPPVPTSATIMINNILTVTTVGPSPTALPTRDTLETSSPISINLTQAPAETAIPIPTQSSSNTRVDRATVVLSVVLGLISATAMVYVGLRVFNKVKSRVIQAILHARSETTIEVYREMPSSSAGMSSLITPQGTQPPPQTRDKRAMSLPERRSARDLEAGRALPRQNLAGGSRRGLPPLVQTSMRGSALSNSSGNEPFHQPVALWRDNVQSHCTLLFAGAGCHHHCPQRTVQ